MSQPLSLRLFWQPLASARRLLMSLRLPEMYDLGQYAVVSQTVQDFEMGASGLPNRDHQNRAKACISALSSGPAERHARLG